MISPDVYDASLLSSSNFIFQFISIPLHSISIFDHTDKQLLEQICRRVDELVSQLEERSSSDGTNDEMLTGADESTDNQMELKTMVDAIAAASQREAEAHEIAITLAKENEELREKITVLIEDNNKLIELYEGAVAGDTPNQLDSALQVKDNVELDNTADYAGHGHEKSNCENPCEENRDIEHLQQQLQEMHEENDKLLGLYEKAMQEKDEFKKLISLYDFQTDAKEEIHCEEKQVNMDGERVAEKQDREKMEELLGLYEQAVQERDEYRNIIALHELNSFNVEEDIKCDEKSFHMDDGRVLQSQGEKPKELPEKKLGLVRTLDQVQDQLEAAGKAVKYFSLLEKATFELDGLQDATETLDPRVQLKQQELITLRSALPKTLERRTVIENKFLALKVALQNVSSEVRYWDKREEQARAKFNSCSASLEQKKQELKHLKIRKDEADSASMKSRTSESELINNIASLKLQWKDVESKRKENERVLFEIDNNPVLSSQRATNFGKASEMLKSEEERSKILVEIKQLKGQLATVQKKIADSKEISEALDAMIQSLEVGIESEMSLLQQAELRLKDVVAERQILSEMQEDGMTTELSKLLVEYQDCIFVSDMKGEEIKLFDEELQLDVRNLEELKGKRKQAAQKLNNLLEETRHALVFSDSDKYSKSVSEKIEIELRDVQKCLTDAKSLLLSC